MKGGKTTPGTIEVVAYADEAGPEYNSPPTDFTVPGLKNTPQAAKVYGRSNGPVTGGASGTVKSVSDSELKQAGDSRQVLGVSRPRQTQGPQDISASTLPSPCSGSTPAGVHHEL